MELEWLLDSDPAIRWQVLRDLRGTAPRAWQHERRRVLAEGWGRRLMDLQEASGQWGGGLYTPKWTSTTYTLLLLRGFGPPPGDARILRACALLLDRGFSKDGGINLFPRWGSRSETCVTGMIFSAASYFGLEDARLEGILEHLLAQQMEDGGWNCRRWLGDTHGSFHTTISVLEGLLDFSRTGRPGGERAACAQARGREFLLRHRLFRSHRTGAVAKTEFTRFTFPPRWHYDALRALDYFRDSGAARDERLSDAIALLAARRAPDGRWVLPKGWPGRVHFVLEEAGMPSRWNTLRALRVLKWWGQGDNCGPVAIQSNLR
jgi:hypothetical protein